MALVFSVLLAILAGMQLGLLGEVGFFVVTFVGNQVWSSNSLKQLDAGVDPGNPWVHQFITWVATWILASVISGGLVLER
jgi:hypothetical protein